MPRRYVLIACSAALLMAAVVPPPLSAISQELFKRDSVSTSAEPLADADVRRLLARLGYRQIEGLHRRGGVFLATAREGERQSLQLVIDAKSGRILGRAPLEMAERRR